jgi:hypothetical protein
MNIKCTDFNDRETLTEIHNVLHSNSDDLRVLKEKLLQEG